MHVFLFCDKYAKIGHGDFMRLRNVSGAKEIIETSKYVILNPIEYNVITSYSIHYTKLYDILNSKQCGLYNKAPLESLPTAIGLRNN